MIKIEAFFFETFSTSTTKHLYRTQTNLVITMKRSVLSILDDYDNKKAQHEMRRKILKLEQEWQHNLPGIHSYQPDVYKPVPYPTPINIYHPVKKEKSVTYVNPPSYTSNEPNSIHFQQNNGMIIEIGILFNI